MPAARGPQRACPGTATGGRGSWRRAAPGTSPPGGAPRRGRAENTPRRRAAPDYLGPCDSVLCAGAAVRRVGDTVLLRSTAPLSAPPGSALHPGRPTPLPAAPGGPPPPPAGSENGAVEIPPRSTGT